jgi:three-Cys-motif partner protein
LASRRKTSQQILAELEAEDDGLLTRPIGIWSLEKLATLLLYFRAFTTACGKAGGGYYVDGMAGPGICRLRGARPRPYLACGSPLIALRSQPEFQQCIFLEIDRRKVQALRARTAAYGERAGVYQGDVNLDLARLLRDQVPSWAPCFCFLDPQGIELSFDTISAVACTPGRKLKPELLVVFPRRMALLRLLTLSRPVGLEMEGRLDAAFGGHEWFKIYEARRSGHIAADDAEVRYLDLYCDKVRALGYRRVQSKAIVAPRAPGMRRQGMYHLIFATDHPAGEEIMRDVFRRQYVLHFRVSLQPPLFEE